MSTTTITESEAPTRQPAPRRPRNRYLFATAVFGLASMGAVALITVGGDSTSPAPDPPPVASQPASSIGFPEWNETYPGCLNDIECNGEPSDLPPGYWDLPAVSSVD